MLWLILSAMARAMMSVVLPAANGTITRIGLFGIAGLGEAASGAAKARLAIEAARRAAVEFHGCLQKNADDFN